MKRALILILAASVSAPALAQHSGHGPAQPDPHAGHAMPEEPAADPHAGHAMPEQPAEGDPHAGHAMPEQPAEGDPHAGHAMPEQPAEMDPHAGHAMPAQPDPHAGHAMPAPSPAPPAAPAPPEALSGPAHAADTVFGEVPMAAARGEMIEMHGGMETRKFLLDRLEAHIRGGRDGYGWDGQFWYGGDLQKFWLKTEGEGEFGGALEEAEVQALWSRAIDPWFDVQLGLRQDFRSGPDRTHLVAAVQGLAPYWFEVEGALFLSNKGELTARFEAEYDLRITQRLILQPAAEIDLSFQNVPEIGLGAGLSSAEIGARLRYEIVPEFAPYVGIQYERAFANTARFRRADGEEAGATRV